MSNELVKQAMPLNEIMKMAEVFAQSGMFTDAKQMGQAFVKIQAGQEVGIPPFASMSGIHIIQGKPTIGAGIIASCIKGSGKYDYKVKEMSEKICSIDFFQGKEFIGNSEFTIEDAKKAGTKNIDKFPKNMLFARAISNGVKWYCPDVFAGPVYVPEEMEHLTVDVKHEVVEEPKIIEIPNIEVAINEMELVATIDDLKTIWTKYKSLQTNADFIAIKDKRKAELTTNE